MGQEFEEFRWAKSRMRAHTLHTDIMVFVGTMFPVHFRKRHTRKIRKKLSNIKCIVIFFTVCV